MAMNDFVYRSRTYNGCVLGLLLTAAILGPAIGMAFLEDVGPEMIYWSVGAGIVALLLAVAGGQSSATFEVSSEGFRVESQNYLTRVRRVREFPWTEVHSVDFLSQGSYTSSSGADIGGQLLTVWMTNGKTVKIVGRKDDLGGQQLLRLRQSIEWHIAEYGGPREQME